MAKSMGAGELREQISFERFTLVDDGFSQTENWQAFGDPVWAEKTDISDGERLRAGSLQAVLNVRFRVRWSAFTAGIIPADRIVFGLSVFEIFGVKDIGFRKWREITAGKEVI